MSVERMEIDTTVADDDTVLRATIYSGASVRILFEITGAQVRTEAQTVDFSGSDDACAQIAKWKLAAEAWQKAYEHLLHEVRVGRT